MRAMGGVAVYLCIVCLVLAAGCASPGGNETIVPGRIQGAPGETLPRTLVGITHPGPGERTFTFDLRLDKNVINSGEPASVMMTVENLVERPLTIRPFPPGVRVRDSCGSIVRILPFGLKEQVIPPRQTLFDTLVLDMRNESGVPLAPGRYTVELFWEEQRPPFNDTMGPPPPIPTRTGDIIIPEWDVGSVVLRYPEGALERVIDINRTVTIAGLTVTLERLEFNEGNVGAFFLYPIPSGTLPPGSPSAAIPPPPPDTGLGLFSIDGGGECPFPTIPLVPVGGLWRVRGDIPPVSRDARTLTLSIPELAGEDGPWIFKVPLV